MYETRGTSEQVLARVLKRHRDDLVVTSKVASRIGDGPNDAGLSRYHILREIDRTLARLETDHIDIYILHVYDDRTPLEETLRAIDDVVRAGKTRYMGVSNFQTWQVLKALWTQDRLGLDPLLCIQNPYNLLNRDLEREMWPAQRDQGFGVMTYSPLGVGLLSGAYTPGEPPPEGTLYATGRAGNLEQHLNEAARRTLDDPAGGRRRPRPHHGPDGDQLGPLPPRGDGRHHRRRHGGSHGGERRRRGLVDHAPGAGPSRPGLGGAGPGAGLRAALGGIPSARRAGNLLTREGPSAEGSGGAIRKQAGPCVQRPDRGLREDLSVTIFASRDESDVQGTRTQ